MAAALSGPAPDDEPVSLADALERYVAFYRIWANELAPLVSAEKREHVAPGARPSSVEATLFAAARGELSEDAAIARLGVLAPAWDVAVPTFAENPALLRDAIARARLIASASADSVSAASAASADSVSAASATAAPGSLAPIADLAERDDFWFARAQWLVRCALRETALAQGIDADDAAWLPLDDLAGGHVLDPTNARRRAAAARAASERAAAWEMPIEVPEVEAKAREELRGYGTGGTVTGRVVRFASLAGAIAVGPRDVIVTRAVTPALAVLVVGCGALVSETGGPLDHGAALARELGIPCVVGCVGAFSALTDGMIVTVDGTAGAVFS
jgi:pyruvate,water dikinase